MSETRSLFLLLSRAKAALAGWIGACESLERAGEALDVSKATAGRLANGQTEPSLEVFLAACIHERDRGASSPLFDAVREDLYGSRGAVGQPLEVERKSSGAISTLAAEIAQLNQGLADGRVDGTEAVAIAASVSALIVDLGQLHADLRARIAAAPKPKR